MSNLISRRVDKSLLLHCNWGWDGKYDGYFAGKAFDAVKGCYLADDNAAVSQTRGEREELHLVVPDRYL